MKHLDKLYKQSDISWFTPVELFKVVILLFPGKSIFVHIYYIFFIYFVDKIYNNFVRTLKEIKCVH